MTSRRAKPGARAWWMALSALLPLASACSSTNLGLRDDRASDIDSETARSERQATESRTLSSLAALEKSINDYVQAEGSIPARLETLIPKYAAEIPTADTGVKRHPASNVVAYYPSDVIRDGVVDGTKLRDTGGWGYVHNDRQVIVFVDCTHADSRGKAWYQERGSF